MIIRPNWDVFKAKFSQNPQDNFEWFCYLLFCREYDLEKGWYGFKNQSAIEKEPFPQGNKVIGFQAKFYSVRLSEKKNKFIDTIERAKDTYPTLTDLIIYTHSSWGQGGDGGKSKELTAIEERAKDKDIKLEWRDSSFFESDFVVCKNYDLARHFFINDNRFGWERYKDWSSYQTTIDSEYFVDDNIKIIIPNHKIGESSNVVKGINSIRKQLDTPQKSVRLIGLSGVGKTKLAQALFDSHVGEKALPIKYLWYCDNGISPNPIPQCFIEELKQQNERFIVIVDNCGQQLHSDLTKNITNGENKISLLTIEHDVSDDEPEKTDIYKLEPSSEDIIQKVIKRHYPDINDENICAISWHTGGNYRLALAIASNIGKKDNLAILTDQELFKRIFYQNGTINSAHYKIARVCSMVFSFNVNDSELNFLATHADVKATFFREKTEELKQKDVVQQRGDFRAILPHVLANHLAKQYIKLMDADQLIDMFEEMPERLRRSFIKRASYLYDMQEINDFVKEVFNEDGLIGKKLIDNTLTDSELEYFTMLSHIQPRVMLNLLEQKKVISPDYFSGNNNNDINISSLIKNLAYESENFKDAFWLLFTMVEKNNKALKILTSMFKFYTSESMANLEIKKEILQDLFKSNKNEILLSILEVALDPGHLGSVHLNIDIGKKYPNIYQVAQNDEIRKWLDFLLNMLYRLECNGYEVRKSFAERLASMINGYGNLDIISRYVLGCHKKKPFTEALHKLNDFVLFNRDDFKNYASKTLEEIQNLKQQLEPPKDNLQQLLDSYLLIDESRLCRYESNPEDSYRLKVPDFNSYDAFIDDISNKLVTCDDITPYLPKLIKHNNAIMEKLGCLVYKRYQSIDVFLKELNTLNIETLERSNFLQGCLKRIKEQSFEDYKDVVSSLIQLKQYQQIIPTIVAQLCETDKDVDYMCELLDLDLDINFYDYYFTSSKKQAHQITPKSFGKLLDCLEKHNCQDALQRMFFLQSTSGGELEDDYVSIFTKQIDSCYAQSPHYFFKPCLKHLLSNPKSIDTVFEIFKNRFQQQKTITFLEGDNDFIVLSELIMADTAKFIAEFIENDFLKSRIFFTNDINCILYYANTKEVINWIDGDQAKIEFWVENTYFSNIHKTNININENGVIWCDLLVDLLKQSTDKQFIMDTFFEKNIFNMTSWMGSYSSAMRERLPLIDSFIEFLENNHLSHIDYITTKKKEYCQRISREEKKEAKEHNKKNQFDY